MRTFLSDERNRDGIVQEYKKRADSSIEGGNIGGEAFCVCVFWRWGKQEMRQHLIFSPADEGGTTPLWCRVVSVCNYNLGMSCQVGVCRAHVAHVENVRALYWSTRRRRGAVNRI